MVIDLDLDLEFIDTFEMTPLGEIQTIVMLNGICVTKDCEYI